MRKIANFILGTIVCLTVLGIIMFFTLYISLIIANENPPSDDAMFRMIQKTYGVDVTQYSPDVFFITTLIISKKPGNTGISRDIRTEFTTDLLLSD